LVLARLRNAERVGTGCWIISDVPAPGLTSVSAIDALLSPDGWAYASLSSVDSDDPGRFHALFGRDSLIFALQVLRRRPEIAAATLRSLAKLQGTRVDPEIDEEPGKILHEFRPVAPAWLIDRRWPIRGGGLLYYGTADATSWFLVVLAATGDRRLIAELTESWQAAARWLEEALERGGGFVWHGPRDYPGGLTQQGWRDSSDPAGDEAGGGILRVDGSPPAAPLADADSQAVALAALRALAVLDPGGAAHWDRLVDVTRGRIEARFTPETMALEAGEVTVAGAGSQLGWLLWADALTGEAAAAAADRLLRPDVYTPFGLRTLASTHPQFRPAAYHRGAVWPFDSWLGWGGLRAAGYPQEAERLRIGVLDALARLGRAPELYASTTAGPEWIPASNRVQAWSVGAKVALEAKWDARLRV
jgi:glycogen debranching enzyme